MRIEFWPATSPDADQFSKLYNVAEFGGVAFSNAV